MKNTNNKECEIFDLLEKVGRQWVLLIIYQIGDGNKYFSTIKNTLPGISSRTLSQRLKDLQSYDMVTRTIVCEQPLRIEYTLTLKWSSFLTELHKLCKWTKKWWK